MKVNRGKDFEAQIRAAFEKIPDVSIDRLVDQMNGFAGGANICDFIVYCCPNQYYIECKSTYGNTLSITSNNEKRHYGAISDTQWLGLLEKSKIKGVVAGYMIWFIDWDKTIFITAEDMKALRDSGAKSLNMNGIIDVPHLAIRGKKKRVLFDYDMLPFLKGENYEQTNL